MSVDVQANSSQPINLEGVMNFRDLGGIKTKDGRFIKKGLLFRAADLTDMTAEDKAYIQKIAIRTIFDYRTADEATKRPDPHLERVNYIRVSVNQETGKPAYNSLEEFMQSEKFEYFANDLLMELYKSIPVGNPSYYHLMSLLKNPGLNLPLVQHCAGGRDRTGVGSMLILLTLGVDWEVIVEDFLLSNVLLDGYHSEIFQKLNGMVSEEQAAKFKEQFLLQERYIDMSYQNILQNYDSFEAFLEQEYGITAEDRKAIQDYCLE
ncbi:tyrosine-protein phosphatase [Gracilibacillus caseinilyticus]|uniref:Tyrosine-protein phosphatase n=1 Tax=Gracilibacillus caseinilyticus TaxID=2932256 RepID=A0ABY4EX99_9BACI|nr:tyrosine-protein phosphatase [Gracilibacillus caseinilyticus]UOQ49045.1 tyrosine-protein phosphatase [Gracilibacillus caseinilyticus]